MESSPHIEAPWSASAVYTRIFRARPEARKIKREGRSQFENPSQHPSQHQSQYQSRYQSRYLSQHQSQRQNQQCQNQQRQRQLQPIKSASRRQALDMATRSLLRRRLSAPIPSHREWTIFLTFSIGDGERQPRSPDLQVEDLKTMFYSTVL